MPDEGLSVEGPEFAKRVAWAESIVRKLEGNKWDFNSAPDAFARKASADVFAKEIVVVFDGKRITRLGRLVMAGVGHTFNLMGPIHPRAQFKGADDRLLRSIYEQTGSKGLRDFPEFAKVASVQQVEFYNHSNFFQLRDLVFWSLLHGSGCSPSTLEHMARHFASGMVVQNVMYGPSIPSTKIKVPVFMAAACLSLSFPASAIEWMDKPLYGGLFTQTLHTEYLLTPGASKISHPYLPLVAEGTIEYMHQRFHLRQFSGITPKNGVRGPEVPVEQQTDFGSESGWTKAR